MKQLVILIIACFSVTGFAQSNTTERVYAYVLQHSANTDLQNKLLVVNVWSANNTVSRDCNKALDKTAHTYQYAKLKGGLKGMVAFDICIDAASNVTQIIRTKDGVKTVISVPYAENLSLTEGNMFFNASGQLISSNVKPDQIFETIHQLVTR